MKLGGDASKNFLVSLCTTNDDASTQALALSGLADWAAPALAALAAGAFAEILFFDLAPSVVREARRAAGFRHVLAVAAGVALALLASRLG